MSNRKKWAKTIKFKHILKKDKVFKSYWIRKFLNKISIIAKTNKSELFLYNSLYNIKKLRVKGKRKWQNQILINDLPKLKYLKLQKDLNFNFKKLKFRRLQYKSCIFNKIETDYVYKIYKKKITKQSKQAKFLCLSLNKKYILHVKGIKGYKEFHKIKKTLLLTKNLKFENLSPIRLYKNICLNPQNKINLSILPGGFLVFCKDTVRWYSLWKKKYLEKTLLIRKHKPITYILRMIDYGRWIFTTQLRRMGKYFHNIPTTITFPRTHNFGIKQLAFALKLSRKFNNFQQKLNVEILNILFRPRRSYSRRLRRQKFKTVKKNAPYAHFKWK